MSKKHIYHLYENYDITFDHLSKVIALLCNGLETTEKIDGQALAFRINDEGKVLFARNKTQQKLGGDDIDSVISSLNPAVHEVFLSAASALQGLADTMTQSEIFSCFPDTSFFCNFEIASENKRNVIMYDGNNIVLHNIDDGIDSHKKCFKMLIAILPRFVSDKWNIAGPSMINFNKSGLAIRTLAQVSSIMTRSGLKGSDGINCLVHKRIYQNVLADYDNHKFAIDIAEKYVSGGKNLRQLKKEYAFIPVSIVEKWGRSNKTQIRKNIAGAIDDYIVCLDAFGREILKDAKSDFIAEDEKTIEQIKTAINMIGDKVFNRVIDNTITTRELSQYEHNLRKLGHTSQINTAIEGVVFEIDGTLFKITGCFAPYNQILGCLGFDKKDEIINSVGGVKCLQS